MLKTSTYLLTEVLNQATCVGTLPKSCFIKHSTLRSFGSSLKETSLTPFHVQHGGKMVEFAGFSMPLEYKSQSIIESHLHTRKKCSVFDVSHMLQTKVHGKDRIQFIESLTISDVGSMKEDSSTLSLFPNESGGIEDDLIITKTSLGHLYLVTNAGCIEKDKKLMEEKQLQMKRKGKDVSLEYMDLDFSLLALQGPSSGKILQKRVPYDLNNQKFMTTCLTQVSGVHNVRVTRCGYTGEDGFELSIPNSDVLNVINSLLEESDEVQLAGLGARDTLRLEAGLCLYGNDVTSETTIPEAGLVWAIGKARRQRSDFTGAEVVLNQIREKPKIRRVGLVALESGPAARHDHLVLESGHSQVGKVTSGGRSPCLDRNIAMAYVDTKLSSPGTKLNCSIRGKLVPYEVVKMPFVPTKYYV